MHPLPLASCSMQNSSDPLGRKLRFAGAAGLAVRFGFSVFLLFVAYPRLHTADGQEPAKPEIDFAKQILPILSDNCFHCHGPDAETRAADLRLDTPEALLGHDASGKKVNTPGVVTPHAPDESELYLRIIDDDEYFRMPPPDSQRSLEESEIALLRQWIESGAPWGRHWSFAPRQHPPTPMLAEAAKASSAETPSDPGRVAHQSTPSHPIDAFVLRELQERGLTPSPLTPNPLTPSPLATKERLLRRITFDLTGLPPTLAELDAFLEDDRPDAYARVVDRLLASPRYGERMAWNWLDAARYADSNGYQGDRERTMWPWRDWVVDALNAGRPFDTFTRQQIAGDLLPDATAEDVLATGFSRNHMINGEGGRIPEENRVEYVFDQAETVGTVWMGLTYQCCRCHDHKYDPLSQENYYELFAIFNQTPVTGAGGDPQTPPAIVVTPEPLQFQLDRLQVQRAKLEQQLEQRSAELAEHETRWLQQRLEQLTTSGWLVGTPVRWEATRQELQLQPDRSLLAVGSPASQDDYTVVFEQLPETLHGFQLEALPHDSHPAGGLSHAGSGNFVLTHLTLEWRASPQGEWQPLKLTAAEATFEQQGLPISAAFDDDPQDSGWAVYAGETVTEPQAAWFQFSEPITLPVAAHVRLKLAFRSRHEQHVIGRFRVAFAGQPELKLDPSTTTLLAHLQSSTAAAPQTVQLTDLPVSMRQELREAYWREDVVYRELAAQQQQLTSELEQLQRGRPKVMVMAERAEPRDTFVLDKGLYNKPLQPVTAQLPPINVSAASVVAENSKPADRYDLAEWLVAEQNPLTARVAVNRAWQKFFGRGLVRTPEDFGAQGEQPTHPELLDWLASEFVEHDWDLKYLHRLIVTSQAYQRTAWGSPASRELDPDNRWLSRGPRRRMPSWMIRDAALAHAGLLQQRIGGPPVKPYQPAGVWADATFGKKQYDQDHGADLYRRSLYTFWRRIVGPTMFFDVAKRQTCTVQTPQTNTPLHALVTWNDTTFVEAARLMAGELLSDPTLNDTERLQRVFRQVTSRKPTLQEVDVLRQKFEEQLTYYSSAPDEAAGLRSIGEHPVAEDLPSARHAAMSSICLLLLNLDESLSK